MKSIFIKAVLFFGFIFLAIVISGIISATANIDEEKTVRDIRPIISVETLVPINHQVKISGFGELSPLESTVLAAQVSGEVLSWHPNFVAGGVVKRGDVLFTIEPDTYEAEMLRAEAQRSLAEATLVEELARQKVAEGEAKNLPQSQVSDLYLRKPQVLSARAQLKSAEASLRIAKRNLAKTKVKAPYNALIISRDIGTGQFVSPGMRVAKLNNIETAEVIVPIAGFDSPFLKDDIQNNLATITAKGIQNVVREGFISRNLGIIDQNTRMQHIVIRLEDPYGLSSGEPSIQFGSYVEVTFAGKQLNNVFKLPQTLVNNRKVWVVNKDNKLESRRVEVVREEGSYFLISNGLKAQTRLAKNLPEYPQEGMEVKILDQNAANVDNEIESTARLVNTQATAH